MKLVPWGSFRELEALHDEVNRLFQDTLSAARRHISGGAWSPPVDITEDDDKIVVSVELPGMKKEDIQIELTDDTLTIRGERKFEEESKDKYQRIERLYGRFQRSFSIGLPVKPGEVKATYKDGLLEITIPKAEEVKPQTVSVKVE